ncbi:MAG TPA: outer membrane protein assembly factor BamD [Candidatus Dormibacteraeota bacterium]|nr:outer membrane protein assembly factor BamD [Candidatus Dormibacteraeota bacterium]
MNKSVKTRIRVRWLALPLAGVLLLSGCFGGKKKHGQEQASGAEPDKVLYERSLEDIRHGRHTVGRLTLQTLINTYPDSDYLAKAKLAIADSFYKEGGTTGLTQAVEEYKNFIIFFPFLPEATYAQLQVAMTHYRRMEKPDRDRSEAKLAEEEFQTFLQKYPDDKLRADAEQRLRDVQEVLAEGDYRIGRYYYIKGSLRAAAGRLSTLTERYPLYSRADQANWMLADIYTRSEHKEIAAKYWARIVREYPLSSMAANAKDKLKEFGAPIPQPDTVALARAQKEREIERRGGGILHKATGILTTRPDVTTAAQLGAPNMTPASVSGGEILTPGGTTGLGGEGASTSAVMTVQPGTGSAPSAASPSSPTEPAATSPADTGPATATPPVTAPPAGDAPAAAKPDATTINTALSPDAGVANKSKPIDKNKESTSKKKKGLRKIVPW